MSEQRERTVVVGGGVIGLCSAYFLGRSGRPVVVLERGREGAGSCSDGNAGMVVPSHFIPLAAPGVVRQGLKWLLDAESPFYVRPRLSLDLMRWGLGFVSHANRRHVEGSRQVLLELNLRSRELFEEIAAEHDFSLTKRGLLMLCESEKQLAKEAEVAAQGRELGLEVEVCDIGRIRELDPAVEICAKGGVWFEQDCHLDPSRFLAALLKSIVAGGGEIRYEAPVRAVEGRSPAAILENGERVEGGGVVIAGGAWSPALAKCCGLRLPMQGGKGYSLTLREPRQLPRLCAILAEAKVTSTPMGDALRFAGTMEICGNDLSINERRVQGIIKSVCRVFPQFSPADFEGVPRWAGLRPCSPDGLPYLGKVPGMGAVIIATGHAMLGLSLGPVTGELVAGLVNGVKEEGHLGKLSVNRFS